MRNFDYTSLPATLLDPEIAGLLFAIHEYRGKQDLYLAAKRDILDTLLEVAKIQSTEASNRIEGIFTSEARLKELVEEKSAPRNRNEQEIAGYRDVLATIHENFEYIPINPNTILQLHRDLYSFLASGTGGSWKHSDNVIAETGADGHHVVRFKPLAAFETPRAMDNLCSAYQQAIQDEIHDPLLLMVLFVFDFLCIHPFNDGNGRMSRLLTLLLLYKSGYLVGKFISIEKLIENSKESYYQTLQESSYNWNEGKNDYRPFVRYYLGTLLKAYRDFEDRVEHLFVAKLNKSGRIRQLFEQNYRKLSKREILAFCPDISEVTVEKTLKKLLDSGFISKVGAGKNTAYIKR